MEQSGQWVDAGETHIGSGQLAGVPVLILNRIGVIRSGLQQAGLIRSLRILGMRVWHRGTLRAGGGREQGLDQDTDDLGC